jgi:hypothetical protein
MFIVNLVYHTLARTQPFAVVGPGRPAGLRMAGCCGCPRLEEKHVGCRATRKGQDHHRRRACGSSTRNCSISPTGDDQGRRHFIQGDSPVEIGTALADFVTAVDGRSR